MLDRLLSETARIVLQFSNFACFFRGAPASHAFPTNRFRDSSMMQKSALLLLAFAACASSLVATPAALPRASTLAAPLARARTVVAADTVIEPGTARTTQLLLCAIL